MKTTQGCKGPDRAVQVVMGKPRRASRRCQSWTEARQRGAAGVPTEEDYTEWPLLQSTTGPCGATRVALPEARKPEAFAGNRAEENTLRTCQGQALHGQTARTDFQASLDLTPQPATRQRCPS